MKYRHELKFLVTKLQLELLKYRLAPVLKTDSNCEDEFYTISSLYFDDIDDRCLEDKEEGCDNRKKYRIRVYNYSAEVIKLECKSKVSTMTKKLSVAIDKQECKLLSNGIIPVNLSQREKAEVLIDMKLKGLMPKVLVEYDRSAFVNSVGNVRITFDMNLRASYNTKLFPEKTYEMFPLLPIGYHILEVKYDEILPQYIYDLISDGNLQHTSFSKYGYSRKVLGGLI